MNERQEGLKTIMMMMISMMTMKSAQNKISVQTRIIQSNLCNK